MGSQADNRAYFESIQNYFLERTGKGLMLSSRDLELLMGWRQSGATLNAVCRGIDEAVERLSSGPRDLYAVRKFVDRRISDSTSAAPVFQNQAPRQPATETSGPYDDALELVADAIRDSARAEMTAALHEVERRLKAAKADDLEPWGVIATLDDFLVADFFDRLSDDEQREIDAVVQKNHASSMTMMTAEARDATVLEGRRAELMNRWDLPSLLG